MNLINLRYEIIRFLGSGNYGLTYLVFDKKTKAEVALKISDINSPSRKVVSQLIQQFYTLKSINNPFIISPYELEKIFNIDNNPFERDIWFYTMPFVSDSKTIDFYLIENANNISNIFSLISKLIYAINFLHQYEISHNDIQKQNILVKSDGKPILLDIFPARISRYQYFEDFKQLFELLKKSFIENKVEIPDELNDFFGYALENQYDYQMIKSYLESKIKDEKTHLYYFTNEKVISTSLFNLDQHFNKIKEKLSNKNIILWEDDDSLHSIKDNFHAFLKVKLQNVLYLKEKDDFYNYLSFNAGRAVSNLKDAEIYLKGSMFYQSLYVIFDDYSHFPLKEKLLINEICDLKKNFYLIRFETFERENNDGWIYQYIYIEQIEIFNVLSIVFNWDDFDFKKFKFSFSVSILFKFLLFIKNNQAYFYSNNGKLFLSNSNIIKIRKKFFDYISEKYNINSLSDEEKKASVLFLTFQKPVSLNLLYSIDYIKIKKTTYLNLINKKIIRYYKNIDSLGIYENIIKQIIEPKIKKEYKFFYINFQNYLFEKWGKTAEEKGNYIKNLKTLKSSKLILELLNFYNNFSIFTYYADYAEIYDMLLVMNPDKYYDDYCNAFKQYFFYSIATLDLHKLNKLHEKIDKIIICKKDVIDLKQIYEISISLIKAGLVYDIETVEKKAKEAEKYLNNSFLVLILFYTYANLLGWVKEAKKIQKLVIENLQKYSNAEYLLFLYALAALENYTALRESKNFEGYFELMKIIYNDSKEEQNWIFYLKAAHNIAVYYSTKEGKENQEKSIQYTKESIYYNERFKIYTTLLISYSNLVIDYLHQHRNHPEAINYLNKLETMTNEAYLKKAIEDEQYLFVSIKLINYYIDNWELQNAKKVFNKVDRSNIDKTKYPLYYEYLALKGLYLLRTAQINEAYKILELMESLYLNKLYAEFNYLYFSLGLDTFFYLEDYDLLDKLKNKIYSLEKSRLEDIVVDYDINYLYLSVIFNKKAEKSLKELILGKDYRFKNNEKTENFYKIYDYYQKYCENPNEFFKVSHILNELSIFVSYTRYNGDIFYSFCDNYVAYIISNEKEYLLESLLNLKLIYSKLTEKERKIFKSSLVVKKFLNINNSFNYYLSHNKSFYSYVEKSSEHLSISYEIMNRIFERFRDSVEDDIELIFSYILKFLVYFGYCTFSAIYKVDETYSIKLVKSFEKQGYKRFSLDYFEKCFKIFLTQSAPFIIKSISYDKLKPHIFVAIPILDYSSQFTRKDSSSVYKFDEYSYFLIFETQLLINPYWSITGEFTTFLENIFSFLNNLYILTQENMYDPLTKVLVRNNFLNKLKNALSKVSSGTLLFIDIDNFKSINDLYSHDFGDKVLSKVANIIKNSIRKPDIVGRYGGEEFLVFIPSILDDAARIIAERIRINIMNESIINEQKITVTIGISSYPKDSIFSDILISKAEIANRFGKISGKNRIAIYNDQISFDSFSKQYINGLIVRDPIKTSENTKILIELLELASTKNINFIDRLKGSFNLIQKTILFDCYLVVLKKDLFLSNLIEKDKDRFKEFIEKIAEQPSFGVIMIGNSIFHFNKVNIHDYTFCIGNFKNFPYLQAHNTLFQLYCSTFFLKESEKIERL